MEKTYMEWEMKNGVLIQVKIGADIWEKVTGSKECKSCHENRPIAEFTHCRKCHYKEAMEFKEQNQQSKELKECNGCHKMKPLTQFYLKKKTGKPLPRCKKCWAKDAHDMYMRRKKEETKTPDTLREMGFRMFMPDIKDLQAGIRKLKEKHPELTDDDIMWRDNKNGNKSLLFKEPKKIVVEKQKNKPEVGISDGTFPLVDSSGVMKDQVDEKTKKKWSLFKSK